MAVNDPTEQPEQQFFADPAIDRLVAMVMTLAAELHVTKDRLRSLESLLGRRGLLDRAELDGYVPDDAERADNDAERDAYVRALMQCVVGVQASKGAPADLLRRFG